MYPGDPRGAPHETYNCRCTLIASLPDFDLSPGQRRARDPVTGDSVVIDYTTYPKWMESLEAQHGKKTVDIAFKKVHNETADRKQWATYRAELGKNAPKTFKGFQALKYDNGQWEQYKDYAKALRTGELSALADFQLYQDTSVAIDRELVGLTTKDGIKITSKSKHFISRVIGSVEQRRNGVSIEDCKRALQAPTEIRPRNDNSVQYILKGVCSVSVNPNTGNLIQVNPKSGGA